MYAAKISCTDYDLIFYSYCIRYENILSLHYSIEKKVKETVRRAFWDAFQAKLDEDPPDFSHALVLIEEIREVCEVDDFGSLQCLHFAQKLINAGCFYLERVKHIIPLKLGRLKVQISIQGLNFTKIRITSSRLKLHCNRVQFM